METKSYLIKEHEETIFDSKKIDEWKAIAESLEAEGQLSLISGENKSMLPFPIMTDAESAIYSRILTSQDNYKRFNAEAVPFEGLALIALCEKEKYFDKIEIWYSRSDPDPIIVGKRYRNAEDRKEERSWGMESYMIFQWGPKIKKLTALLTLYAKAEKERIEQTYRNELQNLESAVARYKFQLEAYQ